MNTENIYYVYKLTYKEQVLYIGSGKNDRIKHVLSGSSNNSFLNMFSIFGYDEKEITLKKVKRGMTQDQSLIYELELIRKHSPIFNVKSNDDHHYAETMYYLEQHKFNRMFYCLGWKESQPYIKQHTDEISLLKQRIDKLEEQNKALINTCSRLEKELKAYCF